MRRFFVKILVFSSLLAISIIAFFRILVSFPNDYTCASYYGVGTMRQIERMQELKEPKIIIIGGSNCAFGLCSPLISEHFNLPVCNTGFHYGIGLLIQINLYKKYINKEDIVIVIPEYHQYKNNLYLGGTATLELLSSVYPNGYKCFTFRQQLYLMKYVPHAFNLAMMMNNEKPKEDSPYSQYSLNEYGDVEMYDARHHIDTRDWTPEEWNSPIIQEKTIRLLQNFDLYCRKRNATMLLFPPVFKTMDFDANKDFIETIWVAVKEAGLPLASYPEQYRMADTLHYDTPYHLTYEGVMIRTNRLIADMDSALRVYNNAQY